MGTFNIGTQTAGKTIINVGNDQTDSNKGTVIWKYTLECIDEQTLLLPKNAKILTVQIQNGKLQLWALLNPKAAIETRYIYIFGTGYDIPDHIRLKYISTVQIGIFVWHIFEGGRSWDS